MIPAYCWMLDNSLTSIVSMYNRIVFAKTGWCETYTGEEVLGRHKYLQRFKAGHERFNFKRAADHRVYGYIPPIGRHQAPPNPDQTDGWLVMFVAPENGKGALRPVGWYRNAHFLGDWEDRPEYEWPSGFERDAQGGNYLFTVSALASDSHCISPELRGQWRIDGSHFARASILYARSLYHTQKWRRSYADLAVSILKATSGTPTPEPRGICGFPDEVTRSRVEQAAVRAVRRELRRRGYFSVQSRENEAVGYDLFAAPATGLCELHIEVKGTQGEIPWFRISVNELKTAERDPFWRLCVVTRALTQPDVQPFLTWKHTRRKFCLRPVEWQASLEGSRRAP